MHSEHTWKQNGDHCHAALQEHAVAHLQIPLPKRPSCRTAGRLRDRSHRTLRDPRWREGKRSTFHRRQGLPSSSTALGVDLDPSVGYLIAFPVIFLFSFIAAGHFFSLVSSFLRMPLCRPSLRLIPDEANWRNVENFLVLTLPTITSLRLLACSVTSSRLLNRVRWWSQLHLTIVDIHCRGKEVLLGAKAPEK